MTQRGAEGAGASAGAGPAAVGAAAAAAAAEGGSGGGGATRGARGCFHQRAAAELSKAKTASPVILTLSLTLAVQASPTLTLALALTLGRAVDAAHALRVAEHTHTFWANMMAKAAKGNEP